MKNKSKETQKHTPSGWITRTEQGATRTPEEVAFFAGPNEKQVLRAIYSAPELLEAARDAEYAMTHLREMCYPRYRPHDATIEMERDAFKFLQECEILLRAAIAKAEGR